MTKRSWSDQQCEAFAKADTGQHLLVHGNPGAGKSTVEREIYLSLDNPHKADRLCFSKMAQLEERKILGDNKNIRTFSGLDWHIYSRNFRLDFKSWKPAYGRRHRLFISLCAQEYWPDTAGGTYDIAQLQAMDELTKVHKMVLATLFNPAKFTNKEAIDRACASWGIELTAPKFVYDSLPKLMRWTLCGLESPVEGSYWRVADTYEFEDLSYQIATNPAIRVETREAMVVDEVQDMTVAQLMVCRRRLGGPAYVSGEDRVETPGQFIGAGDSWQSLYRFRFVYPDMWGRVGNVLGATHSHLTVSYRLAHNLLELPQAYVKHLECHADNEMGESVEIDLSDVLTLTEPGHVFLFLTNAQGIRMTYYLIRNGIPAIMRGTEIGVDMNKFLTTISRLPGFRFEELSKSLELWESEQSAFIIARFKPENVQRELDNMRERCACLMYLWEGAWGEGIRLLATMKERIDTLFTDEGDKHGASAICMTIHRSKGLEFPVVYCEAADLNSVRGGAHPEEFKEHQRVLYVCLTRPMTTRYIIRDSKIVPNSARMS